MAQQTFRNALNGFNREDVVHYIEYLNAQHASEVNRLQSELDFLRSSAQQVPAAPVESVTDELVAQQAARIRELFDQCKAQEATIAELTARLEQVQSAPIEPVCTAHTDGELEAYRRAERTERMARERAGQLYRQANAVLADATVKVDDAAALISRMADQVAGQVAEFQSAITGSKQALQDAAAAMSAIRPGDDLE
ncbi:MAG: hypothetical protein IKT52_12305 [Oscillospiraceae bacterium]|nr:hypothetical protein [Oscillospiraceae bacterium]